MAKEGSRPEEFGGEDFPTKPGKQLLGIGENPQEEDRGWLGRAMGMLIKAKNQRHLFASQQQKGLCDVL